MSKLRGNILVWVIFFYSFSAFAETLFDPSRAFDSIDSKKIAQTILRDTLEIESRFSPSKILDQKGTHTCFAHSTYFLLQYLYNSVNGKSEDNLSIVDILGKTQEDRINVGGRSWLALNKIRRDPNLALEPAITVEDFAKFDEKLRHEGPLSRSRAKRCRLSLDQALSSAKIIPKKDIDSLISTECSQKEEHAAYHIVDKAIEPARVTIPTYNIIIYEKEDKYTKLRTQSEKSEFVLKQIKEFLKVDPISKISYPVSLSLCSRWEGKKCLTSHAVTVIGSGQFCRSGESDSKCIPAWKIVNSWGGHKQGWIPVDSMMNSIIQFPNSFRLVKILPCSSSNSSTDGSDQCTPWIKGPRPWEYVASTLKMKDLVLLVQDSIKNELISQEAGDEEILRHAAIKGDLNILKRFSNSENSLMQIDVLLKLAATAGHLNVVEWLLKSPPVSFDAHTSFGFNALYSAASSGHFEIVEVLIKSGINPDQESADGKTPLLGAASDGHQKIVELLLNHKVKTNIQDTDLWTPLFAVSYQIPKNRQAADEYLEISKMLLKAGADPNITDYKGNTPLNMASYRGNKGLVRTLLKTGASLEIPNNHGWTPLLAASYAGHTDVVKRLLMARARLEVMERNGNTALGLAVTKSRAGVVRQLLLAKANSLHVNHEGKSILDLAVAAGNLEILQLLEGYANVKKRF